MRTRVLPSLPESATRFRIGEGTSQRGGGGFGIRTIAGVAIFAAVLSAHPMGNFSVNHYARIEVAPGASRMTYVLDLAEIPSFELLQKWGIPLKDATTGQIKAKAETEAIDWIKNLAFTQAGTERHSRIRSIRIQVFPGAGAMSTLRVEVQADLDLSPGAVQYEDWNYQASSGWKEVVITAGPEAKLMKSNRSSTDLSKALTAYPTNPMIATPQDVRASFSWASAVADSASGASPNPLETGGAKAAFGLTPAAGGNLVKGDFLSRLLSRQELTWGMIGLGLLAAFGLGAMHALSPGHGKTIVAAYLVGSRGTAQHAMLLGATVTFTHTISVFALGLGVLFFQTYIHPERIIPLLGALSGLSIVGIGGWLLYQRSRALLTGGHGHHHHAHDHHHDHDHDHSQSHTHHHSHDHGASHAHGFSYTHEHDDIEHSHVIPDEKPSLGSLVALGASGGLVPCPSALLLMLSAIGIGRTAFGLGMLVTFSAGLALVLMAIGLAVVYAKDRLPAARALHAKPAFFRIVPVFSAAVVMLLGVLITLTAVGLIRTGAFIS